MPDSLKLADFLDEEFLALVVDYGDNEGWVSTQELADAIPISTRNVGCRLGWLRKYGVVERDLRDGVPTKNHWRLTEAGVAMVESRFSRQQRTALDGVLDAQLWYLSQELGRRYETVGSMAVANLVRRRFTASSIRRKFYA